MKQKVFITAKPNIFIWLKKNISSKKFSLLLGKHFSQILIQ